MSKEPNGNSIRWLPCRSFSAFAAFRCTAFPLAMAYGRPRDLKQWPKKKFAANMGRRIFAIRSEWYRAYTDFLELNPGLTKELPKFSSTCRPSLFNLFHGKSRERINIRIRCHVSYLCPWCYAIYIMKLVNRILEHDQENFLFMARGVSKIPAGLPVPKIRAALRRSSKALAGYAVASRKLVESSHCASEVEPSSNEKFSIFRHRFLAVVPAQFVVDGNLPVFPQKFDKYVVPLRETSEWVRIFSRVFCYPYRLMRSSLESSLPLLMARRRLVLRSSSGKFRNKKNLEENVDRVL